MHEKNSEPVYDEYISSDGKEEHTGLYKIINDEEGKPKIIFDKIEDSDKSIERLGKNEEEAESAEGTEKGGDKKEKTDVNTDAVDREIEALKKRRNELKQEIASFNEIDAADKLEQLKKQLSKVESELKQKDNDQYRKLHAAVFVSSEFE